MLEYFQEALMENPIQNYWDIRLKKVKQALEENNFPGVYCRDCSTGQGTCREGDYPWHKSREHFMGRVNDLYGNGPL